MKVATHSKEQNDCCIGLERFPAVILHFVFSQIMLLSVYKNSCFFLIKNSERWVFVIPDFFKVDYIAKRVKIKRYNSYIIGSAYCSKKGSANLASLCSTVDCRNSTSYKVISDVFSLCGLEAMFKKKEFPSIKKER